MSGQAGIILWHITGPLDGFVAVMLDVSELKGNWIQIGLISARK